jgi:hypothetical protein
VIKNRVTSNMHCVVTRSSLHDSYLTLNLHAASFPSTSTDFKSHNIALVYQVHEETTKSHNKIRIAEKGIALYAYDLNLQEKI